MKPKPASLTSTILFPLARQGFAGDKLSSVLADLRQSISRLSEHALAPSAAPQASSPKVNAAELEQLQATISSLREELGLWSSQSVLFSHTKCLLLQNNASNAMQPRLKPSSTNSPHNNE
jgi:hypothetical protein